MELLVFLLLLVCVWLLVVRKKLKKQLSQEKSLLDACQGNSKEIEQQVKALNDKYSTVISVDAEVVRLQGDKEQLEASITNLRQSYKDKKVIYDDLLKSIAIYDEQVEYIEMGFYKPHFDFDTSEEYKKHIDTVRDKQKQMLSNKKAVVCNQQWQVEGSVKKGEVMTNRGIRLTARAFNNECDAVVANTRWNNAERMEQRIIKSAEALNKLNASMQIYISDAYINLKLDEFRLAYEYQEKRRQEREEQSELRRQLREEEQLKRDLEKAVKDEERYQKLLDKAKQEAEKATGDRLNALQSTIDTLSTDLAEAQEKAQRAMSMAQQTRAGYVYVISNIGAFGEGVYKIGMTRRLEPMDRVRELGDASVPFPFDTHALIYSEDAPSLENALHKELDQSKLNLVNVRREFFKADFDDIVRVIKQRIPDAEIYATPEAREFTESNLMREQARQTLLKAEEISAFPDEI